MIGDAATAVKKDLLMELEYTTEQIPQGQVYFKIKNPPTPGARLLTTKGERVVFKGIGLAGMLECLRLRDSSSQLYFPTQILAAQGQRPCR